MLIAAQALEQRYRKNDRPFLAHCCRDLERELHALLDALADESCGWEPTKP